MCFYVNVRAAWIDGVNEVRTGCTPVAERQRPGEWQGLCSTGR